MDNSNVCVGTYLNYSFVLVVASAFTLLMVSDAEFSHSGMWEGTLVTSWAVVAPRVLQSTRVG